MSLSAGRFLPVSRRDLAMVIEARFEEIFELVEKEIKRSGYAGLLRAGAVITGGSSQLPGYRDLASRIYESACSPGSSGAHHGHRRYIEEPILQHECWLAAAWAWKWIR